MSKKKVFVGLSGGVDSSVAAALLLKAGFDVTGVFIKTWSPDWLPCTWCDERRDAMRVAAVLDIPFLTLDFSNEYKRYVADYMIEEYKNGRTPNPDVMCNKTIKFGSFLEKALSMGADFVATGHYAQNIDNNIYEGADKNKDQSYFLWTLNKNQLQKVLFPVGHLEKGEVRKLAAKFKLPTSQKKDSQGICFLGDIDMKEFLSHYIESKKGNVLDQRGQIIGEHDGAVFYTMGERHGFKINIKSPNNEPYFVIAKNIKENTLTVAHKENSNSLHEIKNVLLSDMNWLDAVPDSKKVYGARIRYRQEKQPCKIIEGNKVIFTNPQSGVSVGQSVVIYDGERCLGGGVIESVS